MDSVMKVTPLDIRKKSFDKVTFGGYDKEDVNAFLQAMSVAWENMTVKNEDLERRLAEALNELNRLRQIEASLLTTLKNLEESNHVLREQAQKEAHLIIQEAQVKANQIVEEAKTQAKMVTREANQLAYNSLAQMREELRKLDYSYRLIEKQKEKLTSQMTDFLKYTLGKITQIDAYKRTIFYEDEIKKANEFMQRNNEQTKQTLQNLEKNYPFSQKKAESIVNETPETATYVNRVNGSHYTQQSPINVSESQDLASFFDSL
jgi:cell division initiation protein